MIGGLIKPKPPVLKPRPVPKTIDVCGDKANTCGRIAREPNTNYDIRFMQYLQRKTEYEDRYTDSIKKKFTGEKIEAKYMKHAENRGFQRELNKRVEKKLIQYDVNITERSKKLADLIAKEERELLREIVDSVQKGKEEKMQERVKKLHEMKKQKEEERLAVVKEKRLQQYLHRCEEFRPAIANQRCREAKQIQLMQIQENECKRRSEEELERFWHEMKLKYCKKIAEREEQDRLNKERREYEMKTLTDLQIKQKIGEEQKRKQELIEDGIRLEQLMKEIEEEERAYLEKKQKSKAQLLESTKAQIKEHQEYLKQISDAETKIDRAYYKVAVADEQIEREQAKIRGNKLASRSAGYVDMVKYQNYLEELKQRREEDEAYKEKLRLEALKDIQRKEDDKKCQIEMTRQALFEATIEGREKQIELHKKRDEELQKEKELELEFTKASREHTDRLQMEYKRQNLLKQKQYGEDLKQQMAYSQILEEREKANMKKILDAAVTENKLYDSLVAEVLSGNIKVSETHPFRNVVITEKCPRPKSNY